MLFNDQAFQTGNFSAKVLHFSVEKYTTMLDKSTLSGFSPGELKDQKALLLKLVKIKAKQDL